MAAAPGRPAPRAVSMSYLIVFFLIGLLIFAHEIGHYLAARATGIRVERVSFGIGSPLWSVRIGPTEYRISTLPLGGYVLPADATYFAEPPGKRLLFALGGPVANLAVTFVLMAIFNVWVYGISIEAVLVAPVRQTIEAVELVVHALPAVLSGSATAIGPVGVLSEGGRFVGSSSLLALQFAAVMSVNLAILNLLPVPPLDGGRIVLCALEMADRGASRLQVPLNVIGFLAILAFLSWTTVHDVRRLLARWLA